MSDSIACFERLQSVDSGSKKTLVSPWMEIFGKAYLQQQTCFS